MSEKKEKKLNKTEKVLNHLRERGCITSLEAIELYRATRLSDIIYRLRSYLIIWLLDITKDLLRILFNTLLLEKVKKFFENIRK